MTGTPVQSLTLSELPPADNSALVEEKTARAPALSLYSPVVGLEVEEAEMLRYFYAVTLSDSVRAIRGG